MSAVWVVTPLTLVDRHQRFGEDCCLAFQGISANLEATSTLTMEKAGSTGFVYLYTRLHGVTFHSGIIVIFPAVRNTDLISSVFDKPGSKFTGA